MRRIIFAAYMIWLIVNPQITPLANSYSGESDTLLIKLELEETIVEAHYFDNKLLINTTNQKSRVLLFGKNGEIYLDKKYDDPYIEIFVTENGKGFFIAYQIIPKDMPYYVEVFNVDVYDNKGKLVNSIENIASKFIDITNDGNYFITKTMSDPEENTDFELYSARTGTKIALPFDLHYQTYFARIIDDQTFIVLFSQHIKKKVENAKPGRSGSIKDFAYEPTSAVQIIYNFVENKIINKLELISEKGNPLYIVSYQINPITISMDRKKIAVSCIEKKQSEESLMSAKYLLISDPYGKRLYETSIPSRSRYDYLQDIRFVNNNDILIYHYVDSKGELLLLNSSTGEREFTNNFNKGYFGLFDQVAYNNITKELFIQFKGDNFLMNGILKFNIEDKNPSFERLDKILVKTQDNTKMFLEFNNGNLIISE